MCRQSGRRFEDFTSRSEAIIAADEEIKNDRTALILRSFARLQADPQLPNLPPGMPFKQPSNGATRCLIIICN